ncbi:TPA: lactate dehydrogenase [Neisseria gonorrhoeae]
MNITKPGARIDRPTIRKLIAYATCRNHPISNSTLLRMEKDGRIPYRLNLPLASPVWDTREVLEALGLQQ